VGNITGNLSGSVGSVTGAVGSVTGAVGSVTGDVGGKVLGGGAGTITGTGVRAVDASGNAIATAAALDTVDNFLDTEINAIKAKTDQMTFGLANQLDVNVTGWASNAQPVIATDTNGYPIVSAYSLYDAGAGADVVFNHGASAAIDPRRLDAAVSTRASQTSVDDLPTNAELATALAAADDAVLAAVATKPTLAQILAGGDVDGYTLEETLKLCLAALSGKLSGAATTTVTIRAADDSKARLTATVDASGNRSAVTYDATG
jgi:hypothetical protein